MSFIAIPTALTLITCNMDVHAGQSFLDQLLISNKPDGMFPLFYYWKKKTCSALSNMYSMIKKIGGKVQTLIWSKKLTVKDPIMEHMPMYTNIFVCP